MEKSLLPSLFIIAFLTGCHCWEYIGNNECRDTRSRSVCRTVSHSERYDSYTVCGFWGCCRCHRHKYRTLYRTQYYMEYYYDDHCCAGFRRHNGICKRAVLGLEKSVYYLEKDDCGVGICANISENNVAYATDDQVHIMNYQVTSNGSRITDGKMFLTSSFTRHCLKIDISEVYRTIGDLSITLTRFNLPNYAIIASASATIRLREDIVIGFEEAEMSVYEDAGNISICFGIMRPANLDLIEDVEFNVSISTRSGSGVLDLDFGHTNSTKSLSKHLRRLCSTVSIVPDHIHEESEEFLVELEGIDLPQYVTISPSTSRIRIINERRNLTIGFDLVELEVLEGAGPIDVCIGTTNSTFLYGGITLGVIIPVVYENDIVLSNLMVWFDGATTHQCLSLNITNDSDLEGNEEVVLTLEVESTSQRFYMEVNPSFMKLKIIDDDSIVIGFDSSILEIEQGSTARICVSIHSRPNFVPSDDINLKVIAQDGTADFRHYFFPGGIFSTRYQENCFTGATFQLNNADQQPRTFSLSLTPFSSYQKLILDPQTILVKITDKGTSSCESGSYHHEELTCSGSCNWNKSNTTLLVSDDVCISKKAVKKYRDATSFCTSEGLFCIESIEEKITRSFNLGISSQTSKPEAVTGKCNHSSRRLDCTSMELVLPSEGCHSNRSFVCKNRSVLFVLDTSSSIGPENFKMVTEAMSELTLHFCGNVQVAVANFNEHVHLDLCFNCHMESRFEMSKFIKKHVEYNKDESGPTNFENSAKCILNQAFSDECGDHTQSDCIDIIYVTDGELSSSSCGQVKKWLPMQDSICSKSKVFAIGVGKNVNVTELSCIASAATEDTETVFQFDTFTDLRKYVTKSVQYLYKKKKYCNFKNIGSPCDIKRIDLACSD